MQITFTKKSIAALTCANEQGRRFVRDTACRGLCVEVRSTGGKTYYLTYRDARGRQRSHKLANAADITPQQARKLCERARSRLAMGEDIAAKREQFRAAPTVSQFFNDSYLPFIKSYKRSWQNDVGLFRNHVQPSIGQLYLDAISSEDVTAVQLKAARTLGNGTTNLVLVLMRYMFNLAIRWRIAGITVNPTDTVPLRKVANHRERFLSAKETQELLTAVNQSRNTMLRYIIPMLLLTGARKREVLDARWSDIDRARSFWRIPLSKSGRERYVPLSPTALALLDRVPRRNSCEWVFANPKTQEPYASIFMAWDTVRRAAGLADVRIHDLRHSFASFLVNAGCSLYEVQKILGHASMSMTQRYSHLASDSLLRAASKAERYVLAGQD